ncbi:uncharacterized protein ACIBXB_011255 [Morphnus guianensis]
MARSGPRSAPCARSWQSSPNSFPSQQRCRLEAQGRTRRARAQQQLSQDPAGISNTGSSHEAEHLCLVQAVRCRLHQEDFMHACLRQHGPPLALSWLSRAALRNSSRCHFAAAHGPRTGPCLAFPALPKEPVFGNGAPDAVLKSGQLAPACLPFHPFSLSRAHLLLRPQPVHAHLLHAQPLFRAGLPLHAHPLAPCTSPPRTPLLRAHLLRAHLLCAHLLHARLLLRAHVLSAHLRGQQAAGGRGRSVAVAGSRRAYAPRRPQPQHLDAARHDVPAPTHPWRQVLPPHRVPPPANTPPSRARAKGETRFSGRGTCCFCRRCCL